MSLFKRKPPLPAEDDIALEKRLDNNQMKKVDRYYIIIACFLGLSWAIWNFGGLNKIKLPDINFNFASDYFAQRAYDKIDKIVFPDEFYGRAKSMGEYLVYYQFDNNTLYSIKKDGTDNKRLVTGQIYNFEIWNDWIVFSQLEKGIFKIKLDGSELTQLSNLSMARNLKLIGDYLYYTFGNNEYARLSLKDNEKETLSQVSGDQVLPYGNWLYSINISSGSVLKSRIGSKDNKLAFTLKASQIHHPAIYRGWLYYINTSEQSLWRCKLDGSKPAKIAENATNYIIEGNKIYYSQIEYNEIVGELQDRVINSNSKLLSAELDGKSPVVLDTSKGLIFYLGDNLAAYIDPVYYGLTTYKDITTKQDIIIPEPEYKLLAKGLDKLVGNPRDSYEIKGMNSALKIIKTNDALYYPSEGAGLFKVDNKGIQSHVSTNVNFYGMSSIGNLMFYRSPQDNFLTSSTLDGLNEQKVFDFNINSYALTPEAIYFSTNLGKLYRAQFSDGKITKLSEDGVVNEILIRDGYLYTQSLSKRSIIKMKLDGTDIVESKLPQQTYFYRFDVVNDYIYMINESDMNDRGIYRQKLGEEKPELIIAKSGGEYFVTDKYIFVLDYTNQGANGPRIIRYDLNGKNEVSLSILNYYNFYSTGDKIYYYEYGKGLVESDFKNFITNKGK